MGRYGRRGTCLRGRPWLTIRVSATARTPYLKQWCCVTSHHERDLLAGLRLSADQQNAAAENQKGHRERGQGPNLHAQDGVDVVGGDVAEHAHHCDCVHHKQSNKRRLNPVWLWGNLISLRAAYPAHRWICWPGVTSAQRARWGAAERLAALSCHLSACWGGTRTLWGPTLQPQRSGRPSHQTLAVALWLLLAGTCNIDTLRPSLSHYCYGCGQCYEFAKYKWRN